MGTWIGLWIIYLFKNYKLFQKLFYSPFHLNVRAFQKETVLMVEFLLQIPHRKYLKMVNLNLLLFFDIDIVRFLEVF